MTKLLIVDDESFTREGLMDLFDWKSLSVKEIRQAFDGINALEICKNFQPDILLTDVRMPRMDGIKLAFEIREIYPNCEIIFMSGYSDKEYLKSAIKLKAVNYIEKPLDEAELLETLKNAIISHNQAEKLKENIKKKCALELINQNYENIKNLISAEAYTKLQNSNFVTVLINLVDLIPHLEENIINNIQNIIKLYDYESFLSFFEKDKLLLHIYWNQDNIPLCNIDLMEAMFFSLSKYLATIGRHFICVGKTVDSIKNINESYLSAEITLGRVFYYDYNSILFYKPDAGSYSIDTKVFNNFKELFLKKEKQECILFIKRLTNAIKIHSNTSISYVKDIYIKLLFSIYENSEKRAGSKPNYIEEILNLKTLNEIEAYVLSHLVAIIDKDRITPSCGNPVLSAVKYINDHYADNDLSLDIISQSTFVTPAYLCVLFKEQMGSTLNKYINDFRLEKSKELLQNPNIKISEIASMVGYSDGNYFTKIFKKSTGKTPSEYRRSCI